ncbi:MAG: 2-dehydro-3-deoxy-D-gluconate 5-dehydrogenase KduD [Hyphomonadaceae bacterium]
MFDLSGKTALVTGANNGLGQGMALALAKAGANIALVGRTEPTETMDQIARVETKCVSINADLSNANSVAQIVAEATSRLGRIDILVNNAGIIQRNDAIDFTPDDWDSVMNVNLRTLFFLSQAFARHLVTEGKGGKIINIASMLTFQGGIRVPSYAASKSGVGGLTKALANEWAAHSINVNAIAPGYFKTNNTAALQADAKRNSDILSRIPSGRWGQPSDLDGAVVFLASAASDYVQGITLAVDGGWLSR